MDARAVAIVVTVAFAVIQWRGIRWGSVVQNVTSAIKAIAFVALSASAFLLGSQAGGTSTDGRLVPTGFALLTAFVLSLQAVIYTYDGWTGVVYFSEEVDNPGRNVPRALFGGVVSISAIYLLMNLVTPIRAAGLSDCRATVCRRRSRRGGLRPSRQRDLSRSS